MNDVNTPRDCSRSATIVFRSMTEILPISYQASYADSRTLHGLGCPPRAFSLSERRFHRNRPTIVESQPPLVPRPVYSFNLLSVRSFHRPNRSIAQYCTKTFLTAPTAWVRGGRGKSCRRDERSCPSGGRFSKVPRGTRSSPPRDKPRRDRRQGPCRTDNAAR